jgi:catechol 2,3-dioxygenase-like lactoylglutathione lyase family enzyme
LDTSLNLIVIRAADLERSQRFYETLGLRFSREKHGNGPEHLAAVTGGVIFEIYPRGNGPATEGVRLGFQVASMEATLAALQRLGAILATPPETGEWGLRAVAVDPDGHRVEVRQ